MNTHSVDTIAAISTAYGESGIGIVRMSGPEALDIFLGLFRASGGKTLEREHAEPRRIQYGHILDPDSGEALDEVLCFYMKGPKSYTAEDLVEIQCHGSLVSLRNILDACFRLGARPAEPGEFTKRAFLNGRIDLARAEAVIDLIRARSDRGFEVALGQAEGTLSRRIDRLRDQLKELVILLTVNMEYPEEDLDEISYGQIEESLQQINDEHLKLLEYSKEGRMIREGFSVTIVGKPNVGKSSLLNFFLRENRAIVTEIPGTTRDTIEEQVSLHGIPVKLTDTAGIRDSEDPVENLGIQRSKEAFNKADLLLFLVDASQPLSKEDQALCLLLDRRRCIVLLNKSDLPGVLTEREMRSVLPQAAILSTSLTEGTGLDRLEETITDWITGGKVRRKEDVLVTNVRHIDLLRRAQREIEEALSMTRKQEAMDFIEVNVRAAFDLLGEITGQTAGDEILEEIFSRFCLGK
ncbi:MAG: tRNA uridine-5-carboxymethylaminomethyl(34) synthesis GTPase MnmE [Eubacteriales bacterium]|nr:tRNA uridine-5-carboxymethylaminomethyl(34) synthesis GTPase MnmE [Eubacteriales bacterium]MDD4285552.1 tRNA uridine-5-carboxymethylaminomethyl(34) synthesis GTPase MnmE [Eubacteriales bacterium]HPF19002.1 tRNA uridine-5-carboxymethylaminomethyl(34) synthesis GTPase MnmE [Bacillota bacterium]